MTAHRLDAAARASHWCIAAVDRAIGRLSTEVGRMDAIDLAAPWTPGDPTRHAQVLALIASLDTSMRIGEATDGRGLAAALVRTWTARRGSYLEAAGSDAQASVLDVLAAVHDVRIALDAGIHVHDVAASPLSAHA